MQTDKQNDSDEQLRIGTSKLSSKKNLTGRKVIQFAFICFMTLGFIYLLFHQIREHKQPQSDAAQKRYTAQQLLSISNNQNLAIENKKIETGEGTKKDFNSEEDQIKNRQLKKQNILNLFKGKPVERSLVIPKKVWRFEFKDQSLIGKMIEKNIKYFSEKDGFQYTSVPIQETFIEHLSGQSQYLFQKLFYQEYLKKNCTAKHIFGSILTKLLTLKQYGGMWVDENVMFYESPKWILDLDSNTFVINKHKDIKAECFTFYDSMPFPSTKTQNDLEEFNPRPSFRDTFIATIPYGKLITKLVAEFVSREAQFAKQFVQSPKKIPQGEDFHKILKQSFDFIMNNQTPQMNGKLPVHHYGLRQIYYHHHVTKLRPRVFYLLGQEQKLMTMYTKEEIQYKKGPLRFMQDLNRTAIAVIEQNMKSGTLKMERKSIFNEFLYMNASEKYFINSKYTKQELQEQERLINAQTFDFPKIVWLFWDNGLQSMDFLHALCYYNIKYFTRQSNYQFNFLTNKNYHNYLSKERFQGINQQVKKYQLIPQHKSDLIRQAILYENGGIYMDETIILTQPLNWLQTIHHNKFVMGRTSKKKPQVFYFYNRVHSSKTFINDADLKNKIVLSPGLENGFIVAVPRAQFISEAIDMHNNFIPLKIEETQEYLKVRNVQISKPLIDWQYLYQMIGYQAVIQLKQKELDIRCRHEKNKIVPKEYALHHYGIITIDTGTSYYQIESNIDISSEYQEFRQFLSQRSLSYYEQVFGKQRWIKKLHHWSTQATKIDFDRFFKEGIKGFNKESITGKFLIGLPSTQ